MAYSANLIWEISKSEKMLVFWISKYHKIVILRACDFLSARQFFLGTRNPTKL
jgi:hypothetical protein